MRITYGTIETGECAVSWDARSDAKEIRIQRGDNVVTIHVDDIYDLREALDSAMKHLVGMSAYAYWSTDGKGEDR